MVGIKTVYNPRENKLTIERTCVLGTTAREVFKVDLCKRNRGTGVVSITGKMHLAPQSPRRQLGSARSIFSRLSRNRTLATYSKSFSKKLYTAKNSFFILLKCGLITGVLYTYGELAYDNHEQIKDLWQKFLCCHWKYCGTYVFLLLPFAWLEVKILELLQVANSPASRTVTLFLLAKIIEALTNVTSENFVEGYISKPIWAEASEGFCPANLQHMAL